MNGESAAPRGGPIPPDIARHARRMGADEYLEVRYRVLWLRREHPDATIETEVIRLDDETAVFRARVTIPGGGSATGHGSETASDFTDYIEKAECIQDAAEILTLNGFRHHSQVRIGEDVLAYDLESDRLVWTPLLGKVAYAQARVVRIASRDIEAIVTPDHTWATAGNYRSWLTGEPPRRMRETRHLRTSDRIILAAPGPVEGWAPITPDEAALIGWLVTDGQVWQNGTMRPRIYQAQEDRVARIHELVGAVGAAHTHRVRDVPGRVFPSGRLSTDLRPSHTWEFRVAPVRDILERAGVSSYEDLPALVTRLSARCRKAMLAAMMEADGDSRGYFGKKRKPGVQEAWQILCTLEGRAVGRRLNKEIVSVHRMKRRRYVSCQALSIEDAGRADVWCPTTALGTWVARLPNGQIAITGNTKALGRALHALGYDLLEPGRQRAANRSAPGAEKGPEPPSGSGSRSSPASRSASASSGGWTEFWQWARAHGYQTRADIERALGGSIEGLPPAEVRKLLEAGL